MSLFKPTRYFDRVSSIDPIYDLKDKGYSVVFLDIDNTLRSRADGLIPPDVLRWLESLKENGIHACLLSNNWHANVFELAHELDLPILAKALKPLPFSFLRACKLMNCKVKDAVMIGDQLSTDVWGANAIGMASYLVLPLAKEDLKHTVIIRKAERVILGSFPIERLKTPNTQIQSNNVSTSL